MADKSNSTANTDRERLSEASLQGCYLDTLLSVIEDVFEDIDSFCDTVGQAYAIGWIRSKARNGLNITYMAQDKAGEIKRLTDDVEKELWLAERLRRNEEQAAERVQ